MTDTATQVDEPGGVHFSLDRNAVIIDVDKSIEDLAGYKKEEVIGQNIRLFINSEDEKNVFLNFQDLFSGIVKPVEFRGITRSGSQILVRSTCSPVEQTTQGAIIRGVLTKI